MRGDVRRQPGSPGGLRRAGQVEHHEPGNRAQLENLRTSGTRFACHALSDRCSPIRVLRHRSAP